MKFYSEKLDQMFDSVEELQSEEAKKRPTKKKTAITEKIIPQEETTPASPTRKELALEVETADERVKEAYANYDAAKQKVEDLSKKYLEEVNQILEPAKQAVKDAETCRYAAIKKFNENYGAYQVTYTGSRAAEELMKAISGINANTNKLFKDYFWF